MPLENFSKEIYKNKLLFGNEMKSWDQPFLVFKCSRYFTYIYHPALGYLILIGLVEHSAVMCFHEMALYYCI